MRKENGKTDENKKVLKFRILFYKFAFVVCVPSIAFMIELEKYIFHVNFVDPFSVGILVN